MKTTNKLALAAIWTALAGVTPLIHLENPAHAQTSPCYIYKGTGTLCYRWVDSFGLSLISNVTGYTQRDGSVRASTPLGPAAGVWIGKGDIRLITDYGQNIVCGGVRSTSKLLGRQVSEGICTEIKE